MCRPRRGVAVGLGLIAALSLPGVLGASAGDPHLRAIPEALFLPEAVLEGQPVGGIGQSGAGFGSSAAVEGDTLVVGAPGESGERGAVAGAVYVFVRSGGPWSLQQKLLASDGQANDGFGSSVSLSSDTLAVAARGREAAYIFVRSGTTWSEQQKLVAADATPDFGRSISLSGDTVAVAAGEAQVAGSLSTFVFVRSGTAWSEQQKLTDPGTGGFGFAVSISGDTLVSSSYVFVRSGTAWIQQQRLLGSGGFAGGPPSISGDTVALGSVPGGINPGSVYVFVRSGTTWSEQQRIFAPPGGGAIRFGTTLSLSGETLVVGSDLEEAYVFVRAGATWSFQQEVSAPDAVSGDNFGAALAVTGESVAAGAPFDRTAGGIPGSAYVFERSGAAWGPPQKLEGNGWPGLDRFGASASLAGDDAIVGAPGEDTLGRDAAGAAYVFARSGTTWTEAAKLVVAEATLAGFGQSASISGDTAVVGARFQSATGGAAYVFARSGTEWMQEQKLVAPDGAENDNFGVSVAVSGDTAVVGASGFLFDAAYVFVRSGTTWSLQQKLVNTDVGFEAFGASVAIEGDTIAVGAAEHDPGGGDFNVGAAYVFVRSAGVWTRQQKLLAADGDRLDRFGQSVAVAGETVVVGAPGVDSLVGAAYVFVRSGTTWTEQQKLTPSVPAAGHLFGSSVSISGEAAAVAAGGLSPAAYVFGRTGTTWSEQQRLLAPERVEGFGQAVALSTDTLLVGASADSTRFGESAGTAHVYRSRDPQSDLGIAQTDAPDPVVGLQPLTYTVNVTNLGPEPAEAVSVADALPAGVAFQSASGNGWACLEASGVVTCTRPTLATGAAPPITIVVTAPASAGSLGNLVSVAHAGIDPVAANNSVLETTTVTAPVADLAIAKSDGGVEARWGQAFTWTITVSSTGPDPVTNATVTDAFPAGVTGVTWTCTASGGASCPASGSGDIAAPVSLGTGGSATFVATGTVVPGTGSLDNTASVAVPAGVQDPDTADNTSVVTTSAGPILFFALPPCRVVDTRILAEPLAANSTRTFAVGGTCGVPVDARAAAVNLTAVNPGDLGNLRLYPTGQPPPLASAINFVAGQTRANNAILPLGGAGEIDVRCDMPPGSAASAHFVLDVFGFFR